MTEERPPPGGRKPPSDTTPSWPRTAARTAANAAWSDLSDTGRRWVGRGKGYALGAWSRRPGRGAMVARVFVLALGLTGAASLLGQSALAERLPTALDWQAATTLLERDARPGDAVVVSPAWAERARAELPSRVPVFALPGYAEEPLLGVRRVWVLSLDGAPWTDDRIAGEIAARAAASGAAQRVGRLTVTRYDLADPRHALAYLPDQLATASGRAGDAACDRDGAWRLRCAGAPSGIAREVRAIDGLPRPCVALPAGVTGGPVAVTFPGVPMGLTLRGSAGVVDGLPSRGGAPVRVAVQVDGQELEAIELGAGGPAWRPFEIRTSQLGGERHAVTLVVTSPDPAGRTACVEAWSVP